MNTTVKRFVSAKERGLVDFTLKKVIDKYCPCADQQMKEDLYQDGMTGLIQAQDRFDPDRGIPFASFATFRIHGAMIDALRQAAIIRLPQRKYSWVRLVDEARGALKSKGQEASEKEIADYLGWTLGQVQDVRRMRPTPIVLSSIKKNDQEDDTNQADMELPAPEPGPEEQILQKELAQVVQMCLEKMQEARDRIILVSRVMHGQTLRELASTLGCTEENVRQRQIKALKSIKKCLSFHGWGQQDNEEL